MDTDSQTLESQQLSRLGISVRAYNYCRCCGLVTAADLLRFFKENGNNIPSGANAGKKTIEELNRVCNGLIDKEAQRNFAKLGISVRAFNYCRLCGLVTVEDLIRFFKVNSNSIPGGANAGKKTIEELNWVCNRLISGDPLDFNKNDLVNSIKTWGLSSRAYNYCASEKISSAEDLVTFYLTHGKTIPPKQNVGNKTISEIENLCKSFIAADSSFTAIADESIEDSSSEVLSKFFELIPDEVLYVNDYKKSHGHLPVFWLIKKLIDRNPNVSCFARAYGIDKSLGYQSVATMAKESEVSNARVGQRIIVGKSILFSLGTDKSYTKSQKYELASFVSKDEIEYIVDSIKSKDVLCSCDPVCKSLDMINTLEGTNLSLSFILHFISNYTDSYKRIGEFDRNINEPEIILVKADLFDYFDFKDFCSSFKIHINSITEIQTINIQEYIDDSPSWKDYNYSVSSRVQEACKSILLSMFQLYDEQGDNLFVLHPRKIDLGTVAYSVIQESGAPLTVSEILEQVSLRYPDTHYTEEYLKTVLRNDTRIRYKRDGSGKTKYLIGNTCTPQSVRDAIIIFLEQSSVPEPLNEIVSRVTLHFPTSTKNSIRTSMLNDSRHRFIQYEDSRFGLASKKYAEGYEPLVDNQRASFDERLIELKLFLNKNLRYPNVNTENDDEASLARWVYRNNANGMVLEILDAAKQQIWTASCQECEKYVIKHYGHLPTKERAPELYNWLFQAASDFKNGILNQTQRKLYLHLKLTISNHA